MTEREEIDMLRRAVADLAERVRTLEAKGSPAVHVADTRITITPMRGPLYGPAGDPPSTGTPMPMRPLTTCSGQQTGTGTALWHG